MKLVGLSLAAALLCASSAFSQVPATLGYQARLTTSAGVPVSGARTIVFALYSSATGGTALWTETQNLTLSNGELSVALGESTPIPEFLFDRPLFLGIKVGSDAEMTPRPKLNASPYSVRAKGTLARTRHIPAAGSQAENGNALKAALLAIGSDTAVAIQLDAGGYDLGSDSISLGNQISLVGAGREVTYIFSSNPTAAVNVNGNAATIDHMTIINSGNGAGGTADGAACVRIMSGTGGIMLSRLNAISEVPAATTGLRNAVWIETSNGVTLDHVRANARGGSSARAIYASAPPNSAFELALNHVQAFGFSTAATPGIGAYIVGHQNVQIRDSAFFGFGPGPDTIALHLQESSGNMWNSRIAGFSETSISHERRGLVVTRPTGWEFLGLLVNASSPDGGTGRNIAVDLQGNSSNGIVHFRDGRISANGGGEQVGLRSAGLGPQIIGAEIGAFGHSGSTALTALQLLPASSGSSQGGAEIVGARIRAFHPVAATDLGAAITTTALNIDLDGGVIQASDDGIEFGTAGNAGNPNGGANVLNVRIESGRNSVRKHQNWGVAIRNVFVRRFMLAEPGGFLSCVATASNATGTDQFLPTGCPLAP